MLTSNKSFCLTQSHEPVTINPLRAETENTAGNSVGGHFQRARGPYAVSDIITCFTAQLRPAESHFPSATQKGQWGNAPGLVGSGKLKISAWMLPLHERPDPLAVVNY